MSGFTALNGSSPKPASKPASITPPATATRNGNGSAEEQPKIEATTPPATPAPAPAVERSSPTQAAPAAPMAPVSAPVAEPAAEPAAEPSRKESTRQARAAREPSARSAAAPAPTPAPTTAPEPVAAPAPEPAPDSAPEAATDPAPEAAAAIAAAAVASAVEPTITASAPEPVAAPATETASATASEATTATAAAPPTTPASASVNSPTQRESWPTQGLDRAAPATPAPAEPQAPAQPQPSNKRKRSESSNGRSSLPTQAPKRTQEHRPDHTPARTADNTIVVAQSNGAQQNGESQGRDKETWYTQPGQEGHPQHQQQHPPQTPQNQQAHGLPAQYAQNGPVPSAPIVDPRHHPEYAPATPQSNGTMVQYQNTPYSEPRPNAVVQHTDPKKRKRNFSNRTKTGCLTCRRRKKKCDEGKPECNNCIKGAFVCAGYPPQRGAAWPKAIENKPSGVPLESKDPNYVRPGAYGMPASPYTSAQANNRQPNHPHPNPHGQKREPLPHYRQPLRIEPPNGPPDNRGPDSGAPNGNIVSPEHKLPPGPYTPGNPYPTPVSAINQTPIFGDRGANDYQHGHHHPTESPTPTSSAQMAAQMALSHAQTQGQMVPYEQRRPTQKEEMLGGGYFFQYDTELCMERERAAMACWRFNTLTWPPNNGVSSEERARLFLEILQPRESAHFPANEASPRSNVGRVGRHVSVDTPFHCDYGYNITIGNNVNIGRNGSFNDAAKIQIGDNTIIGPNVSIYTVELSTDPKHRQGGQGAQLGKGVIIDSDCWIGGGAIIMPGKVIGKGSTVGAGSVVTKDVPPFTVVAGNPARVLRGVASL